MEEKFVTRDDLSFNMTKDNLNLIRILDEFIPYNVSVCLSESNGNRKVTIRTPKGTHNATIEISDDAWERRPSDLGIIGRVARSSIEREMWENA